MPTDLVDQVSASVEAFRGRVEAAMERRLEMDSPRTFRAMEQELAVMTRELGDEITGAVLRENLIQRVMSAS